MNGRSQRFPNNTDASEKRTRRGGPGTPRGKEISKLNALKTGIFAKVVLTAEPFRESRNDFELLLADLRASCHPHNPLEHLFVENLGIQFLRLARTYKVEAEVAQQFFCELRESAPSDAAIDQVLGEETLGTANFPAVDLLMRYEAGIWRNISRILDRLNGPVQGLERGGKGVAHKK